MPPKRKASDDPHVSPSKRTTLSTVPSHTEERLVATPTSNTTPKKRRTYRKTEENAPDGSQAEANHVPDNTQSAAISSPSKRQFAETQSKLAEASVELGSNLLESSTRVKRPYSKKLVVEVPPLPPYAQLSLPPSWPPSEPCGPLTTPPRSKQKTLTTRLPSERESLLTSKHLPLQYYPCLNAQKKAVLHTLQAPTIVDMSDDQKSAKGLLQDLLLGTVTRSEGNSCLVLGPRESGKSTILDQCLDALPEPPIVVRLSGWIHRTDRLAMREIAYQLGQQTGQSFLQVDNDDDDSFIEQDENPFLDRQESQSGGIGLALPPSSHLPALISVITTLSRPTVVVLDVFDLFALHPRQALLYCLLDTVQGCRTGMDNKGLAVVGITTRIDTINLLEKRVKSRFSGRVIRTAGISTTADFLSLAERILYTPISPTVKNPELVDDWNDIWKQRTSECFKDKEVINMMKDTVGITKDPKLLHRLLIYAMTRLSPTSPFLSPSIISQAISSQRSRPPSYDSLDLPYPALCLLISSIHTITSGHDLFTFEMLFAAFRNQLRASMVAPVQVNGGSVGMVRCSKAILLSAFESLVASRMFVAAAAVTSSNSVAKEFSRYRLVLEINDVRKVVEKAGQVTLKKWLTKAG